MHGSGVVPRVSSHDDGNGHVVVRDIRASCCQEVGELLRPCKDKHIMKKILDKCKTSILEHWRFHFCEKSRNLQLFGSWQAAQKPASNLYIRLVLGSTPYTFVRVGKPVSQRP